MFDDTVDLESCRHHKGTCSLSVTNFGLPLCPPLNNSIFEASPYQDSSFFFQNGENRIGAICMEYNSTNARAIDTLSQMAVTSNKGMLLIGCSIKYLRRDTWTLLQHTKCSYRCDTQMSKIVSSILLLNSKLSN